MKALAKGILLAAGVVGVAEIMLPADPTAAEAPVVRTLQQIVRETAAKYGNPPALAEALVDVESNWNVEAMNVNVRDGKAKSRDHGLMQINDATAKRYGVSWLDLYNPETNAELGNAALANCRERTKKLAKNKADHFLFTVACYNAGEGNIPAGMPHARKVMAKLQERLLADL